MILSLSFSIHVVVYSYLLSLSLSGLCRQQQRKVEEAVELARDYGNDACQYTSHFSDFSTLFGLAAMEIFKNITMIYVLGLCQDVCAFQARAMSICTLN
jgi:hypothetical protein